MPDEDIPELRYLRQQGKSTLVGGGATLVIPKVCHRCGDDSGTGPLDKETGWKSHICWTCLNARQAVIKSETK